MNFSVRQKLSFTFGIILFLFLIISAVVFVFSFKLVLISEVKKDLNTLAVETLRNHLEVVDGKISLTIDKSGISPREEFSETNTSALFLDSNLGLVSGFGLYEFYDSKDKASLSSIVTLAKKSAESKQFQEGMIKWRGKNAQTLATPIKSNGRVVGVMVLSKDISQLEQIFDNISFLLATLSLGAFVGSLVLGNLLVKQMFLPLSKLTKTIEKIDLDKLDQKLPYSVNRSDEFDILVARFNEMQTRLKESSEQQKEFAENVSHELKTPLTKAISGLELAQLEYPGAKNDLEKIRSNLFGLNRLIENILYLAGLKKHNLGPIRPTNLRTAVDEVVGEFRTDLSNCHLKLHVQADKRAEVFLPTDYLKVVIRNILGNAIKYSHEGGTIEVLTKKIPAGLQFLVINGSDSVSQNESKKIFQRFYRGSTSGKSGHGIGLAIVKRICELYEIDYSARVRSDKRLEVSLVFK